MEGGGQAELKLCITSSVLAGAGLASGSSGGHALPAASIVCAGAGIVGGAWALGGRCSCAA